jgi:uncharacterized membrane protein YidH (DUF202 family)
MAGVMINIYAALRFRRYVHALDTGNFRNAYTMTFIFAITLVLAFMGVAAAIYLAALS